MSSGPDVRGEIRQFLTARRGRLTPDQVGLPNYGGRRRVTGLRREEVALLAGISIEYYTRLERGNVRGVSDQVIDDLSRALQLDDVERAHLIELIGTAKAPAAARRRKAPPQQPRRSVLQVLHAMTDAAAFVRNARLDMLATNDLGSRLYSQVFDNPALSANLARFVFLDGRATDFYRDWNGIAGEAVGSLRQAAGRNPGDRALSQLIGELSIHSEAFRSRWAAHDVRYYRSGTQSFRHPVVGDVDLDYDALEIPADPGLTIVAYTAARDSAAHTALTRLSAWATHPRAAPKPGEAQGSAGEESG